MRRDQVACPAYMPGVQQNGQVCSVARFALTPGSVPSCMLAGRGAFARPQEDSREDCEAAASAGAPARQREPEMFLMAAAKGNPQISAESKSDLVLAPKGAGWF